MLKPTNIVKQYGSDNLMMNTLGELFYCNNLLKLELPFIAMIDYDISRTTLIDYGDHFDEVTVPVIVMSYANIEEWKEQLTIEKELELIERAHNS